MRIARLVMPAMLSAAATTLPLHAEAGLPLQDRLQATRQSRVDGYIHDGLPFLFARWGPTRFRQLSGLGTVTITEAPGQDGDGQVDSMHEFDYGDMKVWLWCVPKGSDNCLVEQVTVSGPARKTRFGVRVGETSATLRRVFGEPTVVRDKVWQYSGSATGGVHFVLEGDRIRHIVWVLYTG